MSVGRWLLGAVVVAALAGAAVEAALLVGQPAPSAARPAAVSTRLATVAKHTATGCRRVAPNTAVGYSAMFAHTPLAEWGGGDVALSVPVGARRVWLFGDTLSTGRFVHSTAITQTGGCLRVSHHGAQLLPNGRSGWYWITAATRYGAASLRVKAVTVRRTGDGVWDFATGRSRYAIVTVNTAGDVSFSRWLPGTVASDKATGTLLRVGPGHITYGRVIHADIRLGNGRLLTTVCQNWDDGVIHPLRKYAPLFS